MKTIKLTLIKSLIIESVKNETFLRGQVEKAASEKAITQAYHEQAGDEKYQERLLQRAMYTAHADLTTLLTEYVSGSGAPVGDNLITTNDTEQSYEMLLSVSDRFNDNMTDSLAKLCAKYIEESMLVDWWKPLDEAKSRYYLGFLEKHIAGIRRCFNKKMPDVPTYKFPVAIHLEYPNIPERGDIPGLISSEKGTPSERPAINPMILYGNPWFLGQGDTSEITYTLEGENGEKPIDDIMVRCDSPCCVCLLTPDGHWSVKGKSTGISIVTLFSRHNDRVFAKFAVRVV